jgi:hypothetical protein
MQESQEVKEEVQTEKIGPITEKFALKNIEKFFNKKADEIDKKTTSKLDGFISAANAQIKKTDEKFSGMFNILVREFLSKLENRIYTNELSSKALLIVFAEKFHKIESDLKVLNESLGTSLNVEDYLKEMELKYVGAMSACHSENEKQNNQQEVANVEPVPAQEEVAQQQ